MRLASGRTGANLARNAVLGAGWPIEVSAATLNRFCGSGLQAVHFAAMGAASGALDLVVAGGVESMSRVPMGSDGGGEDGGNVRLRERFLQVPQEISADLIATLEGFSREEADEVAFRSQRRCTTRSVGAGRRWKERSRNPARGADDLCAGCPKDFKCSIVNGAPACVPEDDAPHP